MKKILIFFSILLCLSTLSQTSAIQAQEKANNFEATAKHALVVEVSTGKILYDKDSDTLTGVGSITKLLTAYLVYEAIEDGKLDLDTTVTISNYAYNLTFDTSIPNVPLDARSYSVKELLTAMLVTSSNSAAIALAEEIGGTEPKFVDKMTSKLKEWGIRDAQIYNASGLKNELLGENTYPGSQPSDENMMSAKAVAIVAQKLLLDFPQVTKVTSQLSAPWRGGQQINTWNYMLKGAGYERSGINGLITGSSESYGSSFVASATENDMSVISVILNADHTDTDPYARFTATNSLLDYVAENFYMAPLIKKGQSFGKSQIAIANGKSTVVTAVASSDFNVVQQANHENTKAIFTTKEKEFQAPVKKNTVIGSLTFDDQGYLDKAPSLTMVSKKTVDRSIFLKVWWNEFVDWVNTEL